MNIALHTKYPKTPHLPWSKGICSDDTIISSLTVLQSHDVVVTIKMDGENTSLYSDGTHARSCTSRHHISRDWIKQFHASIAWNIDPALHLIGEYCYAKHSIHYHHLDHFFYLFAVKKEHMFLSWNDVCYWADRISVPTVPVLYQGPWNESIIKSICPDTYQEDLVEGYVVRIANGYQETDHSLSIAKCVRSNHNQTDSSWKRSTIIPNKLTSVSN